MIVKAFIVSILSVAIFLCALGLMTYLITPKEYDTGGFVQLLFYGGGTLIPLVFACVFILNLVVQWRIRYGRIHNPNTIYFLWSLIFTVLPVVGFVVFDYADRGRYFEEKTFLSITGEYAVYFLLAVLVIFLNRKISWINFKGHKLHTAKQ